MLKSTDMTANSKGALYRQVITVGGGLLAGPAGFGTSVRCFWLGRVRCDELENQRSIDPREPLGL